MYFVISKSICHHTKANKFLKNTSGIFFKQTSGQLHAINKKRAIDRVAFNVTFHLTSECGMFALN